MFKPNAKDEADIAAEQEEIARQEALRQTKEKAKLAAGICHNCFEPTPDAFCDVECRKDWEKAKQIRARQGGRAEGKERPQ